MRLKRVICCAVALLHWGLAQAQEGATVGNPAGGAKRRPLVVMKQAAIGGRVFFLAADEDEEGPATGLPVQVRTIKDNKLLYQTKTDDQGRFTVGDLDVAAYNLLVGRLRLKLVVENPPSSPEGLRKTPKIIVVFMPRDLA